MTAVALQAQLGELTSELAAAHAELEQTNSELMRLTLELDDRVAERTAELAAAHAELERTNSELMQVTLELDDRVAQRTADLHATNESLRASEERFRIATESANDVVFEWDLQQRVQWIGKIDELLGYAVGEFPRTFDGWLRAVHPDDRAAVSAALQAHLEKSAPYATEYRVRDKGGCDRWWSARGTATRDARGKPVRMIGTITDITERKQADEVQVFLAQTSSGTGSEPFFNALARYLAASLRMDFICIDKLEGDGLDARTLAVWCDGKFEDNVTYALKDTPCGDVVGQTVCCFPANVCQFFPRDTVLKDLRAESYIGVTLWSHAGQPIGLIALISQQPLANRAQAEATLKLVAVRAAGELERLDAEESLRTRETEFRSLAESMPQIVWATRADGWNIYFNQQWVDYTGMTLAESYGHGWNAPFHPDDRQRAWDAWQDATTNFATYSIECRLRRADGSYRWWLVRGVPMRHANGKILKWFGTCTDIHDLKQAEAAVRELNLTLEQRVADRTAELQAANKELETFAYSVSHDLRAPLRSIDGFSKIVLSQHASELSTEARESLEIVRTCSQQMGRLIEELLVFSRLSRQAVSKARVVPVDLIRDCLALLKPDTADRHVEIVIGELPSCDADPGLLKLVWMNLLSNALKYTRRRDPAHIEIGCLTTTEGPTYFVRDDGVGFKMAYAHKLFGVFQRLHRAEDYEGTGVGLATAQRIVARHGGRIWAEAEVDRGATFFFTLQPALES